MRRVLACCALVGMAFALTSCGLIPLGGGSSAVTGPVATGTPSATGTPVATPAPPKHTKFAKSPAPATADPLLDTGKWGYLKITKVIRTRTGVTSVLHRDITDAWRALLTQEESTSLTKVFRNSARVKRAIKAAGGRSSDATYSVVDIQASDDVGIDTPWVYATLRANFPTRYGGKVVECHVYRQKTSKGLDRRPLVSSTIAGYVEVDGSISNPVAVRLH
jgi:hypothetical protein